MGNEIHSSEFKKLDYGTKPAGSKMEVIEVVVNPELMLRDFARAYRSELFRRNTNLAKWSDLTEEELFEYFTGIVMIRIERIKNEIVKEWRKAKELFIPAWIQHTISMVGIHIDQLRGLKFVPTMEISYDMSKLIAISDKLGMFRDTGLKIVKDAFPRTADGDPEVMSMIIAEDCVKSIIGDAHPASSYVAAFLGFRLREDMALINLYRVKYDDIVFIHEMLLREEVIRQ